MARTKKEFSKEAMYKKIMPSMNKIEDTVVEQKAAVKTDDKEKFLKEDLSADDSSNNAFDFSEKSIIESVKEEHVIEKKDTFNESSITVNLIELLVLEKMESVLKKFVCCKCQSCLEDIKMLAVNSLPAYSYTGTRDGIDSEIEALRADKTLDIPKAIIKAIITIRKKDKH